MGIKKAMHITGISNQEFMGVTKATKAVCNSWFNADSKTFPSIIVAQIEATKPDLVIIGGWSPGFDDIIDRLREFPVMVIWHGTQFYDEFLNSEKLYLTIRSLYMKSKIAAIGFAHPGLAEYERKIHGVEAYFIPHTFKIEYRTKPSKFNIHVVGKAGDARKNGSGQYIIAKDFADNNPGITVTRDLANIPNKAYIENLKKTSLLLHMSLIECYPNTIQEAWCMGIPVIFSSASSALLQNPALTCQHELVNQMMIRSSSDPMELYKRIRLIYRDYDKYSDACYGYAYALSAAANSYTKKQLEEVCEKFKGIRNEHSAHY
jgi:hypothetical protein